MGREEREREKEMGKYMRKCRGIGEVAVMDVSQVVGVRTRAMTTALAAAAKVAKRKRAVSATTAEYQIAYLQLRSRSLVMTLPPRISRSEVIKSDSSGSPWCLSVDRGEISRCESNASCEVPELRSDDHREAVEGSETAACYSSFRREREMTPLSNRREELYDLESTAERQSVSPRPTAVMTPSDAEIDEFFAAAEKKETQLFATTYNFDVVNNVPLEGRYEWVRVLSP